MQKALYRSFRPRRFCEVVGQDNVVLALKNQVSMGRTGQAYIFSGTRGTGKTTLAKILAKAVNCPDQKDGEPCGVCDICIGIDNGSILDVSEIDAASNTGVDSIRELKEETAYIPVVCRFRVYIIDETHMLSANAWAALLKIIEEPPAHVMFIFATTDIHKVPATILSRCQRYDLKRITIEIITERLFEVAKHADISLDDDAAALIARLADGALRDALSILDTAAAVNKTVTLSDVERLSGVTDKKYLFEIAKIVKAKDTKLLLEKINELYQNSIEPLRLCFELIKHYRNVLTAKLSGTELLLEYSKQEQQQFVEISKEYKTEEIFEVLSSLETLANSLSYAMDKRLTLELSLIMLCDTTKFDKPQQTTEAIAAPVQPSQKATPPPSRQTPDVLPVMTEPQKAPVSSSDTQKQVSKGKLESWDKVVANIRNTSPILWGFMVDSKAYLTDTHILIDAGEMFMKYMRDTQSASDMLKKAIFDVTGIKKPIGPYNKPVAPKKAVDELEMFISDLEKTDVKLNIIEKEQ